MHNHENDVNNQQLQKLLIVKQFLLVSTFIENSMENMHSVVGVKKG